VLAGVASAAIAAGPYNAGFGYRCKQVSVTSATVPVAALPSEAITTWLFHVETGSATGVYVFPYVGTLPTAVPTPSGVMEVAVGAYVSDAVTCDSQDCLNSMGSAWAAVLFTGSTAVNLDACGR